MMEASFQKAVIDQLGQHTRALVNIEQVRLTSGGSINHTYSLFTNQGHFFLKFNQVDLYPRMFKLEKEGLELLQKHSDFKIPKVILESAHKEYAYLLIEGINTSPKANNFWTLFGQRLAAMHKKSTDNYGLDQDNYIGSLPQKNVWKDNWTDFFVQNRLHVQEKLAFDNQLIDPQTSTQLAKLYGKMEHLFPISKPSLLHGDLWSGNFMCGVDGQATIFDPAVYYGNREMDIAMTHLFGGFQKEFYNAYQREFPLDKGWEDRIEICNLYPLLVHVNLFGTSYANRVKAILKRYA